MNSPIFLLILFLTITSPHLIQPQSTQSHSKNCYSQGLFFLNSTHLFQTCGLYNQSYFHVMEYTADPFKVKEVYKSQVPWKINIFLEGAVLFKGYLYMLTWRENVVYKLDPESYEVVEEIKWRKDGWGLTHNQTHMFTTDGSDTIYLVDQNFSIVDSKKIVTQMGRKLRNINELEYVDGYIYANIYLDTKIVKIDYEKGKVVQEYDGSKLVKQETKAGPLRGDQVINGIAYDEATGMFLFTGKHWGSIYQVQL